MKRIYLVYLCVLCLACSCAHNGTRQNNVVAMDTTDSTEANNDTIGIDSAEVAPPPAVDELFADFIYSFSTNHSFQYRRTDFPLKCYENGKQVKSINRIDWKFDRLYYKHSLHIIILDSERKLKHIFNYKPDTVKLEQLMFSRHKFKQYVFAKVKGNWRLLCLNTASISSHPDASFLTFYERFATDSAFQNRHLDETIDFATYDEDNHFTRIEGTIDGSQWSAFRPEIPANDVFCIDYGIGLGNTGVRVVSVRGNSNGMSSMYKFRETKTSWNLVKFEN